MRHPVARLLKQQTAPSHARVEHDLDLLGPCLSPERLRTVIGRFAGFWPGVEAVIDRWAQAHPQQAAAFDWPRRRRSGHLRADLAQLGATPGEIASLPSVGAPFAAADDAVVLGWLYVSEGSTLGGAVIDRALRARPDFAGLRLSAFTPYPEGPAPMWRSYLEQLSAWVADDDERCLAVVASAEQSFAALATWLGPIAAEIAA